ncbi:hypothetical protein JQN72_14935 [Phycicoccus sp. CSK15P-2]|uniref:hypothetical protein n=1 Tax=Phycicoccus sp. CSK15P-2 TaxID=2807627 RepID=UPI001950690E|nr:hypothetical protein [Phycicoccus sp. CSK15P-2]MBM6405538.1 hypothetical protein [Phycicoccus sp. CSK15P-2]
MPELSTIEEVAERLRVKVLTIRWLRQEGRFPSGAALGRVVRPPPRAHSAVGAAP